MIDTMKLHIRFVGISIRAQMQYKTSFIMAALRNLLITAIEYSRYLGSVRQVREPERLEPSGSGIILRHRQHGVRHF